MGQPAGGVEVGGMRRAAQRAAGAFEVRAIAEESSHEVLAQNHAVQSVCEQIAHAMGIAHRYCDPDSRQRQALDIRHERDIRLDAFFNGWETDERRLEREIRASYAARERYWLNQLIPARVDINTLPSRGCRLI